MLTGLLSLSPSAKNSWEYRKNEFSETNKYIFFSLVTLMSILMSVLLVMLWLYQRWKNKRAASVKLARIENFLEHCQLFFWGFCVQAWTESLFRIKECTYLFFEPNLLRLTLKQARYMSGAFFSYSLEDSSAVHLVHSSASKWLKVMLDLWQLFSSPTKQFLVAIASLSYEGSPRNFC